MKDGARGVRIAAFSREYIPTGGRCPACVATMDDRGCRLVDANVIGDARPARPDLAPKHDHLRDLLLAHPYVVVVECRDPVRLAEQRAWDAQRARS